MDITKESGQTRRLFDEHVQHLVGDVFYFVALHLVTQPGQHAFLIL